MAKNGVGGAAGTTSEASEGVQEAKPVAVPASAPAAAPKAAAKSEEKPQARNLADAETGKVTVKSVAKCLADCCRTRPMSAEVAQEAKRLGSALHRQAGGLAPELAESIRKFYTDPTEENGEAVAKLADGLAK